LVRSITELLGRFEVEELDLKLELELEVVFLLRVGFGRELSMVEVRGGRLVPQASQQRKLSGL